MIAGHRGQQAFLSAWAHQVVLLTGPDSVGKATIARQAALDAVPPYDFCEIRKLTSDGARALQDFAGTFALSGSRKVILIDLDGASAQACNQLLKVLEEPPDYVYFLLVASEPVLPTIASRSVILRFGLLPDEAVYDILVGQGMSPDAARRVAPLGGGRVEPALQWVHDGASRTRLSRVLKAVSQRDAVQLDQALRDWDDAAHELLEVWAAEAGSGRWRVFDATFAPGIGRGHGRAILGNLGRLPLASSRLAASAALAPLVARR